MKIYIVTFFAVISIVGCNSFLDEQPSKSTKLPITTVEQLDALLGNYTIFYGEADRNAVLCTDDYSIAPMLYNATKSTDYSLGAIQVATWDVQYIPFDDKDDLWGKEYKKIFHANTILKYLDKVSGDAKKKAELKAEAHLIRAYSYMLLANTYSLPYNESTKNELGVPLKSETSFEESLVRATLEQTHALIVADLIEALKNERPLQVDGKHKSWRGNVSAARALAARYYLNVGNYSEALKYANDALRDYNQLIDYNSEFSYHERSIKIDGVETTIYYPMTYQYSDAEAISYKEFYLARAAYYSTSWYIPSQNLMNLYDKEYDLRYRYHFVEQFSKVINAGNMDYPGYVFMGPYNIPSGPTTSEMVLIKAEAQARLGQWQDGLNTLETLREKRIEAVGYNRLTASNREEALLLILKERRLERPFTFSWQDAKRYNANDENFDDIEYTKEFYSYNLSSIKSGEPTMNYKLKKGDRKWARPIPNTEIESSLGQIKQNSY